MSESTMLEGVSAPRWDDKTQTQALEAVRTELSATWEAELPPPDRRAVMRAWFGSGKLADTWEMTGRDYLLAGLAAQGAITAVEFYRLLTPELADEAAEAYLYRQDEKQLLRSAASSHNRWLRRKGSRPFRVFMGVYLLRNLHREHRIPDRDFVERFLLESFRREMEPYQQVASPWELTPDPYERQDLRTLFTVSVDPQHSEAYDDALSLDEEGRILWVHIADVAAHLPAGSPSEEAARCRGNSAYLSTGTVMEMLPADPYLDRLSLVAGHDRPALSVRFQLDPEGGIVSETVHRTLIQVDENLSFRKAATTLDQLQPSFLEQLLHIAGRLRGDRQTEGTYRDLREPEFDDQGRLVGIRQLELPPIFDAIEDLMIATNRAMGRFIVEHDRACIFRGTLESGAIGYGTSPELEHHHLGIPNYLHSTSPLRRFADVEVARVIHAILDGRPSADAEELEGRADLLNERFRLTRRQERLDRKLTQALIAERYLHTDIAGTVTGLKPYGLFVTTREFFTGLIYTGKDPAEDEYAPRVGDPLTVNVEETNPYTGDISLKCEELELH